MANRSIANRWWMLAACALALATGIPAAAQDSYEGRPVYSEPGTGLQLPPGCRIEPPWRARLADTDLEVWVVDCNKTAHTWLLRRSLIEMVGPNQARLRFQILDDRAWPGETAGESASVQCTGRGGQQAGFVVLGAKWRNAAANELRLSNAQTVIRGDVKTQKFAEATLAQVDCARYPGREAMLLKLQNGPRK